MHTHNSQANVSPRATGLINMKFVGNGNDADILVADELSFKLLVKKKSISIARLWILLIN
ncbi:hypothetical protein [Arcticibacter svalbardensis]|nr:hypothetical protein [Arcticibacter svalbardensis]